MLKMPTLDFWIRLPLAALIIIGIWTLYQPGMLLGECGNILEKNLPKFLTKPLFDCPPCMSSIWGTWIWVETGGDWLWWIPFCLALCGILKIVAHNLLT
jgi:hypothetical protein